jgi:hypothetical protein
MANWEWEHMADKLNFNTWRMKVPGGYLIKTTDDGYHSITSSIIFVPEVKE